MRSARGESRCQSRHDLLVLLLNGEFGNNHFSTFGRQQKQQQQYKIIIINYKKINKCRAAGQIGCQATGNSPGSPDGQSAPGVTAYCFLRIIN